MPGAVFGLAATLRRGCTGPALGLMESQLIAQMTRTRIHRLSERRQAPLTRNGAVSSAVLVHHRSHPLCVALTGATRAGVAGVGTYCDPLARLRMTQA
jgi:hypothetical protein